MQRPFFRDRLGLANRWRWGAGAAALAVALAAAFPAGAQIAYEVEIVGLEEESLVETLRSASQLVELRERLPANRRVLDHRIDTDLERLRDALRARGYFAADVDVEVSGSEPAAGAGDAPPPLRVALRPQPGPLYRIGRVAMRSTHPTEPRAAISFDAEELGLQPGDPADSTLIRRLDGRVRAKLARTGYPLAEIAPADVVIDHATRLVSIDMPVDPGPSARFGEVEILGLEDVDRRVVARRIAWRRGQSFDAAAVEATRRELRAIGIFSSIGITYADALDANGELPVTVTVRERAPRTIGAGLAYSTSEGPSARVFWEHRNLFGRAEKLHLRGQIGETTSGVFADFVRPDLGMIGQDVTIDFRAAQDEPNGFETTEVGGSARLERPLGANLRGSAGVGLERSRVEDGQGERNFTLLSLPLALRRDTSDVLLDPTRGNRLSLGFTPFRDLAGRGVDFMVARVQDTQYLQLVDDPRLILAAWGRLASIVGAGTLSIPANRRLYAGGPGSVRAYGLNKLGPVDAAGDPVGGRSLTEFGTELRWRVWGDIGIVGFVEAGAVNDSSMPGWDGLRWGAGGGLRYHTPIGPVRLDVAFPLDRRPGVDDSFQLLVSLGQAF